MPRSDPPRFRRRLNLARENGYLNAVCREPGTLLRAYTRWCWRLHLPAVWTERLSPYSRYGHVRLDLFTTPHRLTAEAQVKLRDLAPVAITSPHDACLEKIALRDLDRLAAAVLRIAVTHTNLQLVREYPAQPTELRYIDQPFAAVG